jgi:putative SOS response-associated peptidase YedK
MCGRFTQRNSWSEIQDLYDLTGAARNLQPHYNIAPTDPVDIVKPSGGGAELVSMRWGSFTIGGKSRRSSCRRRSMRERRSSGVLPGAVMRLISRPIGGLELRETDRCRWEGA